jgi:hypothetical protein
MNKRIFALIVASSILALPITAQEGQANTKDTQYTKEEAYNLGFKQGIAGTLAASCIAMLISLDMAIKNGLHIPVAINCRSVPNGYKTVFPRCSPTDIHCSPFPTREPQFKIICDDNPLYEALRGVSGEVSVQGKTVNVRSNMIQEIVTNHASHIVLATCCFLSFGAFCYYSDLFYKNVRQAADKENAPSADKVDQSTVETAA